jgi:hypothetical protein
VGAGPSGTGAGPPPAGSTAAELAKAGSSAGTTGSAGPTGDAGTTGAGGSTGPGTSSGVTTAGSTGTTAGSAGSTGTDAGSTAGFAGTAVGSVGSADNDNDNDNGDGNGPPATASGHGLSSVPDPQAVRRAAAGGALAGAATDSAGTGPGGRGTGRPGRRPDGHLGVDVALRTLVVPEHDDGFWDDLAERLTDEPQLRLRPRAAVRPITQPPPIIDDRPPGEEAVAAAGEVATRSRKSRVGLWIMAALLVGVVVAGLLQRPRNDDGAGDDLSTDTTATGAATTAPGSGATGPNAGGTTAPPVAPVIDPVAPLTPTGVGPLQVGTTIRDLTVAGIVTVVDQPTFDGTAGACFDGTVQNVNDLQLRFRAPDGTSGVTDPADAVLASIGVDAQLPSLHGTEVGIALGATADQVRAAYPGQAVEAAHPFIPGGLVMTVDDPTGTGNGIAFFTDSGGVVTAITAGAGDLIGYPEGCG